MFINVRIEERDVKREGNRMPCKIGSSVLEKRKSKHKQFKKKRVIHLLTSKEFKLAILSNVRNQMIYYKQEFPKEGVTPQYMTHYLDGLVPYVGGNYDTPGDNSSKAIGFTIAMLKKDNVSGESYGFKGTVEKKVHACFYNAVDLVHRNSSMKLAYGIVYDKKDLSNMSKLLPKSQRPPSDYVLLHAFVIKNGKIIDPTMTTYRKSRWYIYETVPNSVWRKWKHKLHDEKYDAREFEKYIFKQFSRYKNSFSIVRELEHRKT